MANVNEDTSWGSRNLYLMILICQSIGISATATIPRTALEVGALGFMLMFVLCLILVGIPLVYMELIIGQFTGFNSFEVWQVRPCLSHIGYVVVLWQLAVLIYNYTVTAFVIRYLILSLGHITEYLQCGPWASPTCGILARNYTIHQDCVSDGPRYPYCEYLYTTYPEVQFFRKLTGYEVEGLYLEWRLCLPSALLCVLLYLSSFMKRQSVHWFIGMLTVYPCVGIVLLMLGSMMQKGVVLHYYEAMDFTGESFYKKFHWHTLVNMMVYIVTVGTGMVVDAGSNCPFRAPCYANTVLMIAANVAFHVLVVCTTAMMVCPYAFERAISTSRIMNTPSQITIIFERIPTWLREYDYTSFWLIVVYSSYACLSVRKTVIIYYNLLQFVSKRFCIKSKYYALVAFCTVIIIFIITMPFLGNMLLILMGKIYRRSLQLVSVLIAIIECFVFIIWYGLDRFCEDVHFMQGIRPSAYMKFAWVVSGALLVIVFSLELWEIVCSYKSLRMAYGVWLLGLGTCFIVGVAVVKVVVGLCRRDVGAALRLSAEWRPRSELLQRSRTMFTAQAMTKEYLYRQYHLQAAILARQQRADRTRVISLL